MFEVEVMPALVSDVDTLKAYIEGVMERADHHAHQVRAVALVLAGAIVWRKDDAPIEVMASGGDLKNVLWAKINGRRYAFSYNHDTKAIEMRSGTTQGAVLHSFDDRVAAVDVHRIFAAL